jgi:hypothetical protein
MIVEKLGAGKVTIFDMSEILREALTFVDPSQKQEEVVVDPKAKGAKKVEEKVVLFAGQDTTAYRKIAENIFSQI